MSSIQIYKEKTVLKFISLFSGAMGLDLGLEMAGFECATCVENDKDAVNTIKYNKPNLPVFDCSITEVTGNELKKAGKFGSSIVPLVVGGPPCQAFSVFGNRLGIEDARGQLVFEFLRIVEETNPATFLMENVRGLLSMSIAPNKKELIDNKDIPKEYFEKGSLLRKIFNGFNELGYHVDCFVVNSVNYGAPQIRERILLIGNRFGHSVDFPPPQYSNRPKDHLPPFKTLGETISPQSGFVDLFPEAMNFSPRKLKYLSMVPEGGNWRSLPENIQQESMGRSWYLKGGRSAYWRKLSYAFPSPTVVTMPNHAGTSMCHPKELRAISVGEAAAIQEFPAKWKFQGTTTAKFRQVGNAVPPRLGRVAGEVIKGLLEKIKIEGKANNPRCGHTISHLRPHVRTRTFWKDGESFSGDKCYYDRESEQEKKLVLLETE
ncbi:MAG: DNA cytosine methyltransferase [Gammaproteobacteria bacterium]|nr:DNA cytosine methyltransferase [Gammaproteobacteria bacterium]